MKALHILSKTTAESTSDHPGEYDIETNSLGADIANSKGAPVFSFGLS